MVFVVAGARIAAIQSAAKRSLGNIAMRKSGANLAAKKGSAVASASEYQKFDNLPGQIWVKKTYDSFAIQMVVVALIVGNFLANILNAQYLITSKEDEHKELRDLLGVFEVFFVVAFSIELVFNQYGSWFLHFWCGPDWAWNTFDAVVVILSVVAMVTGAVPGVSALRTFRAFRILRLFKRVESLKLIIEGVLASLPGVSYAFVVLMLFVCVWAIMGVDFFRDAEGPDFSGEEMFGDFPKGMFTMIQCLTTDGWIDYMSRPLALEPHNLAAAPFFFVSFVFMTVFVMSNVIVAILLQEYLTKCQQISAEKQKKTETPRKSRKHEDFQQTLYKQQEIYMWYQTDRVQLAVAGLIFCNFIVNIGNAWVVPEVKSREEKIFAGFDIFFAAAFAAELLINMYGSWYKEFWEGSLRYWNMFDFITVLSNVISMMLGKIAGVGMLRLLRAARVFRLFKRIPELRMLIEAILLTAPAVMQTFMILLILMSIWAIIGVEFFGEVRPDQFGSFALSLLTMWQVLTVDSWSTIARNIIFEDNMWASAIFFVTFIFLNAIVMSNVVIAVLLEGYLKASHDLAVEARTEREARRRQHMSKEAVIEMDTRQSKADLLADAKKLTGLKSIMFEAMALDEVKELLGKNDIMSILGVLKRHEKIKELIVPKVEEVFGENKGELMKILGAGNVDGQTDDDPFSQTANEAIMMRLGEVNEMRGNGAQNGEHW